MAGVAVAAAAIVLAATVAVARGAANDPLSASFHLDGSPPLAAMLSFAVSAHGSAATAQFQLFAETGSPSGYVVSAGGASIRTKPFPANSWTRVDVTPLLRRVGGTLSLRLSDPSPTAIRLAGAKSSNPPVLLLRTGSVVRRLAPQGAPAGAAPAAVSGASEQGQLAGGKVAVIAAAGDIACDPTDHAFARPEPGRCGEKATSDLMLRIPHLTGVLPLGDDQYQCGRSDAFAKSYAPTWGRLLKITHPVPGNHEYGRICKFDDATPYFTYFGRAAGPAGRGWYSYDLARWHLIALNSECTYGSGAAAVGGCGPGSPQERWLRRDLAANHDACTLAYWHEPRFSSGEHGDATQMSTIWNDLVAAHADIVLSGHNHDYERFAPIGRTPAPAAAKDSTTTGAPVYQPPVLDPTGIREFVVGTGGKNLYRFEPSHSDVANPPLPGERVRNDAVFGVLELTLLPKAYTWRFVSTARTTIDRGSGVCH